MSTITMQWRHIPSNLKQAAVALGLGLVLSVQLTSQVTNNGVISACSYLDVGELVGGATAAFLGLRQVIDSRPSVVNHELGDRPRGPVLALSAAAAVLGVLLVLKGLGLLWSPCP